MSETILNATYILRQKWKMFLAQRTVDEDYEEEENQKGTVHYPTLKFEWDSKKKPETFETRGSYPVQEDGEIKLLNEQLDKLILNTSLAKSKHQVGLLYDEVMMKHFNISEP